MRQRDALRWGAVPVLAAWLPTAALADQTTAKQVGTIPATPPVGTANQALDTANAAPQNPSPNDGSQGPGEGGGDNNPHSTEPISIIKGGGLRSEQDIRIPCPLIDLEFHRDYMSNLKYSGPLGAIWNHSYDWQLYTVTDHNSPRYGWMVLRSLCDPNAADYGGMFHWFKPLFGGMEWQCQDESGYLLQQQRAANTFTVYIPNGREYVFNATGRLLKIRLGAVVGP